MIPPITGTKGWSIRATSLSKTPGLRPNRFSCRKMAIALIKATKVAAITPITPAKMVRPISRERMNRRMNGGVKLDAMSKADIGAGFFSSASLSGLD